MTDTEEVLVTFDFAPPNEEPARFFMTMQRVGTATEVYTVYTMHPTSEEGDVMLEMEGGYFDEIYDRAFEILESQKVEYAQKESGGLPSDLEPVTTSRKKVQAKGGK